MSSFAVVLAPWEIEPGRCPDRDGAPFSFRASWFGIQRDFIGQLISADQDFLYWWFCLADEPEAGNFLCTHQRNPAHPPCVPEWDLDAHARPENFATHVESESWGCLFVLDAELRLADGKNGCCMVFLATSGWGRVSVFHQGSAEFQWSSAPCAAALASPDRMRCLEEFASLARTPSHPLHFVLGWASMRRLERLALALPLKNGDYEQWQRVFRLYAIVVLKHREGWASYHEISLVRGEFQFGEPEFKLKAHFLWQQTRGSKMQRDESGNLDVFLSWCRRYFGPQGDDELQEAHPCVHSFINRSITIFSEFIERPTEHERQEALVELSEWLSGKATPTEIEELLRVK